MSLLSRFERGFNRILDVMAFFAGLFVITVMLLICYMVLMRYFFGNPQAWVIEICEYLLLFITFFGSAWLLRRNLHVSVDMVVQALPAKWQRYLRMVTWAAATVAWLILTVAGVWVTWDNYRRGIISMQTLSVPKWILLAVIPWGGCLLSVQSLLHFAQTVKDGGRHQD